MKRFIVEGGLGRLSQFPKTVIVVAKNEEYAYLQGMGHIRQQITDELGKDNPMLNKIINIDSIREYVDEEQGG